MYMHIYIHMHAWNYAIMKTYNNQIMLICKYVSMQDWNYKNIEVCKNACLQVCMYSHMKVCKYASKKNKCIKISKYASMQLCQYTSRQVNLLYEVSYLRLAIITGSETSFIQYTSCNILYENCNLSRL